MDTKTRYALFSMMNDFLWEVTECPCPVMLSPAPSFGGQKLSLSLFPRFWAGDHPAFLVPSLDRQRNTVRNASHFLFLLKATDAAFSMAAFISYERGVSEQLRESTLWSEQRLCISLRRWSLPKSKALTHLIFMVFKFWLPKTSDKTHTQGGISQSKMNSRSYMPEVWGGKKIKRKQAC